MPNQAKPFQRLRAPCKKRGATVMTNCAVRGVETEAGRLSAVVTEKGTVRTQAAILAGGAWSTLFCRPLGISLPQIAVRGSVLSTGPAPEVTKGTLWSPDFALRRRLDGGYTMALGAHNLSDLTPDYFRWLFR